MRAALLVTFVVACGSPQRPADPEPAPPDAAPVADAVVKRAPDPEPPAFRIGDAVVPTAYDLRLELDSTKESFAGTIAISIRASGVDHVWLHAAGLDVTAATLDGTAVRKLDTSRDDLLGLALPAGTAGDHTLALTFAGHIADREVTGLFRQQDGKDWYLYSQFEAMSARRAFPCFDEPSFKVPWTITLVTPPDQQAFSNGRALRVEPLDDGRQATSFATTPPIPSYLVAVAAGPFEIVDVAPVGRDQLPARIIVPAGRTAAAATAAKEIPRIVEALEGYFDMALPFDKVDSIAIPQFFGAMENPGLITYESSILLASPAHADEAFRHRMMSIVGHELAHQWFGNYVTMAWWDDIWLNESFATWMAEKVLTQLEPSWDAAAAQIDIASAAMAADAQLAANALQRNVQTAADVEGGFDAIAYSKGGAVLSMFERWIGETAFRDGVRAYMKAHARGNADSQDFLDALAGASTAATGDAFRAYLEQPGVPLVRASLSCEPGAAPKLVLQQERLVGFGEQAPAGDLWPIQVCAHWGAAKGKGEVTCGRLDTAAGELALPAKKCPAYVHANAGADGYYRVAYDDALRASLRKSVKQLTAIERMVLAADQAALLDAGQLGAAEALALVDPLLATGDGHDLASAVALIRGTEMLVADDQRPAWRAWVIEKLGKRARKAPLSPPKGEDGPAHDARLALLELVGGAARDAKLGAAARKAVKPWLDGKAAMPRDAATLLLVAARAGGDAALFERLLERAKAATDRNEAMALWGGVGAFVDAELMARAAALAVSPDVDIYTGGQMLGVMLTSPEGAIAVGETIRAQWDVLVSTLPGLILPYLVHMQSGVCDAAGRSALADFVTPRADKVPDGPNVLVQALGTVDRCIARRAALGADLAKVF